MKIRVTVNNVIPSKHAHRAVSPKIEVEDAKMPNETPMEAYRRISLMANAMFAREVLDQLRFTDRMFQEGNEHWCDELLSTIAEDHPAMNKAPASDPPPPEVQAVINTLVAAAEKLIETVANYSQGTATPSGVPPAG